MSDGIREFAEVARRFCRFVESLDGQSGEGLEAAYSVLAELILAGTRLPSVEAPELEGAEVPPPKTSIGFGRFEAYWEVFDPYVEEMPVAGSLSDDFVDIHADLSRGLRVYDQGNVMAAAWEWRFGFDTHWGHHAVDALRALHRACRAS